MDLALHFFASLLGTLAAIGIADWKFSRHPEKKLGEISQPHATVVGEKTQKRAPAYNTPEKAALYEQMEGRPVPPQWRR
jgi:hypothetical protein